MLTVMLLNVVVLSVLAPDITTYERIPRQTFADTMKPGPSFQLYKWLHDIHAFIVCNSNTA
jgi:hypothetical protein